MKTRDSCRGVGGPGHGPHVLLSLLVHDAIVRRDCTKLGYLLTVKKGQQVR